jgi:hypothetical protein
MVKQIKWQVRVENMSTSPHKKIPKNFITKNEGDYAR